MLGFLKSTKNKQTPQKEVVKVAERQLNRHRDVIESLRDYDAGKKDIRTTNVKQRLQDLHSAS